MDQVPKKLLYLSLTINIWAIYLCFSSGNINDQNSQKLKPFPSPPSNFYYKTKASLFRYSNIKEKNETILFLGNSLTDLYEWQERFPNFHCINWGISGDNIERLIERIKTAPNISPSFICLEIGINDFLSLNRTPKNIATNYQLLLKILHNKFPNSHIILSSLFPTLDKVHWRFRQKNFVNNTILNINQEIKGLAKRPRTHFIDLYPPLSDCSNMLNPSFTFDGLHLNGLGYSVWSNKLENLINHLR